MKNLTVIFSPLALEDIQNAVLYYERIQSGIGKRFVAQLQLTLGSIKRNPYFASVRYDDIRCAQVKNPFSYSLLY